MAILQEKTWGEPWDKLKLTIVIPTYNRTKTALALAKNLRDRYPNVWIIVVDQLSKEKIEAKWLIENNIQLYNLHEANLSAARNYGAKVIKRDVILFFDDDVEVPDGAIDAHMECYEDKKVVAVAGRVINDGEKIPKKSDVETGKTNFLHTKFIQNFYSTKKQFVDFPYGCNMSFRRSAFKGVGGFDEKFSKIFDEIDMGVRIAKVGKIIFEPEALVYHHKALSGGIRDEEKKNKNKMIYLYYGYFLRKNVPFPYSMISLILRTVTVLRECPYAFSSLYKGYLKI